MPPTSQADADAQLRAVTVAQLLASPVLRSASVAGGAAGDDNPVHDVVMTSSRVRPTVDPRLDGALVVVEADEHRIDTYHVDVALRSAHQSGASGMLLVAPHAPPALAAVRLADKLGLPLVVVPDTDALVLADELRRVVRTPHLVSSQTLLRVVDDLRRAPQSTGLDAAVRTLGSNLDGTISLVGADGTAVAGEALADPPLGALRERPATVSDAGPVDVVQPLQLAPRERASFWLICRLDAPTAHWAALVRDSLGVASWYVTTRLVAERLQRERDARFRLGVLNAILGSSDRPDGALMEQLGVLGWRVDGWCTGIHLATSGDSDPLTVLTRTDELIRLLAEVGISGATVERADGWSLWLVDDAEPPTASYRELGDRVRTAAQHLHDRSPRTHLHAGIGRPYRGLSGLRESLTEAHEAATIARAAGGACVVRHIDEMGLRRILVGWYTSESFAELARTLLGPLMAVDRDGELLDTLETYLDCESSATEASVRLNLHRNTVINRVDRLRSLLAVDLEDSDERLAVQLACRVVKLRQVG